MMIDRELTAKEAWEIDKRVCYVCDKLLKDTETGFCKECRVEVFGDISDEEWMANGDMEEVKKKIEAIWNKHKRH